MILKYFLFITMLSSFTFSQTDSLIITGLIKDKSTNEPIDNGLILIKGTSNGTMTDFDGNFKLSIKNNSCVIQIGAIGYSTIIDTISATNKSSIILNYELEPDFNLIDEVMISLSKEAAMNDISSNHYFIYEYFEDSLRTEVNQFANKYGFEFKWFDRPVMIYSVDDYNNYVIKTLEKRNGENWFSIFQSKLKQLINNN